MIRSKMFRQIMAGLSRGLANDSSVFPPKVSRQVKLVIPKKTNAAKSGKRFLCTTTIRLSEEKDEAENLSYTYKSFEEYLFTTLCDDQGNVSVTRFLNDVRRMGLRLDDPRLKQSMERFNELRLSADSSTPIEKDIFMRCIKENIVIYHSAFTREFIIPEFARFTRKLDDIFKKCRDNFAGTVADYIPQLARFSPNIWGMSVCTIDGQRHSNGEAKMPFCLQSCSKPLTYVLALSDIGCAAVHQYVGQEPSGESFNMIKLDSRNKPHNPMINAGAIVIASLFKNQLNLPDRFDLAQSQFRRLAGGEFVGFNNAVFLSEKETANRNFALGYYLKENKCFPEGVNLMETLDLYFQLCSIEVNCDSGAVMAATLANGGICPITGEKVLNPEAVRDTLSLMYSCGMYDYSGQFAFKVGLPAKSGVSGAILLVVPNVMGICLWSPPLDVTGNSVRGLQFCDELVETFNFHNYDNLKHTEKKLDPCRRTTDVQGHEVMTLLFAGYNGDLHGLKRLSMSGTDMSQADYDGRTALHLCAAEGHARCVRFLLDKCHVPLYPKDRWGQTPLDDAKQFGYTEVVEILEEFQEKRKELTDEEHRTLFKGAYKD